MSAVVCGKRSNNFEDSPASPPVSKRIRCSSSSSPPGGTISLPTGVATSNNSSNSVLDHLAALFPDMDKQFLEKALEKAGGDLDLVIKGLNEFRLSAAASVADITQESGNQFRCEVANSGEAPQREELPTESNLPVDGAEWVELLVREVLSAPNVDDAKARLSQALEALEKSISGNATTQAAKGYQQEHIMVKQQLEVLLHENTILKRAVSIQYDRQKTFEEMGPELHQLKQRVSQYQEQVRALEVNNYTLSMHLKRAQQNNPWASSH